MSTPFEVIEANGLMAPTDGAGDQSKLISPLSAKLAGHVKVTAYPDGTVINGAPTASAIGSFSSSMKQLVAGDIYTKIPGSGETNDLLIEVSGNNPCKVCGVSFSGNGHAVVLFNWAAHGYGDTSSGM